MLPSYRTQSTDLRSKSIEWSLYEDNTGTKWVKLKISKKNIAANDSSWSILNEIFNRQKQTNKQNKTIQKVQQNVKICIDGPRKVE